MAKLNLTFACSEYDHVTDLLTGAVTVDGIDLNCLTLSTEELFFRTTRFQDFDIAEMSFARYVAMLASGDDSLVGLPVFPSRMFRQSAIFVRSDSAAASTQDLNGGRIGIPEWAQTAGVYVRGWLSEDEGVDLKSVDWFQGGVNDAGREETFTQNIAADFNITRIKDKSLTDMLLARELDAMIAAHPPAIYENGDDRIQPLVANSSKVEEEWFRKTGIYPIMHLVVLKRAVYESAPWVARNLYTAFEQARVNSLARLKTLNASRIALPWAHDAVSRAANVFGDDWFPYGLEENRASLDAFIRYAHAQGLCASGISTEDLFPERVLQGFRV